MGMGGDPSQRMYATAKELLWRQRVIHKFPCDREAVILSLLPHDAQSIVLGGKASTVEWKNLTNCVTFGHTVLIELDGEMERAFWFKFKKKVPVGIQSTGAFELPKANPFYVSVKEWWEAATKTHAKLLRYDRALFEFFGKASHPLLVEKYWPELHKFVDYELPPTHKEPNMKKRRIVTLPEDSGGIIETLAGSTLLGHFDCRTWVDYETETEDF